MIGRQLIDYSQHHLLPLLQSGFRPGHSTEAAVLRVLSDILEAVDCDDFAAVVAAFTERLTGCVDVAQWMSSNRLQLNCDKTMLLWCLTIRCQNRLPTNSVSLGGFDVQPSCSVRHLGIYINAVFPMRRHIDVIIALASVPCVNYAASVNMSLFRFCRC
jgi:hypothetical protein